MNEPMLKKAMTTLEFLSQDAQTRIEYEARLKFLRDEASRMEWAKDEGRAEGIEEGRAEGKEEMARALLALGVDLSQIAKASGLSEEKIKGLENSDK